MKKADIIFIKLLTKREMIFRFSPWAFREMYEPPKKKIVCNARKQWHISLSSHHLESLVSRSDKDYTVAFFHFFDKHISYDQHFLRMMKSVK